MGSIIQDVMIKFQGDTTGLANATSAAKKEMSDFYKRIADYTPKEQKSAFAEEGSRYSKIVQDQRAKVVKLMNDTNAALVAGGKVTTATVNKIRREYAILQDMPNRLKSILPRAAFTPAGVLTEQSQLLMKSMTSRKLGGLKEEIAAIEKKAYAISLSETQKYEEEKQDKLRNIRLKATKKQISDKIAEDKRAFVTAQKSSMLYDEVIPAKLSKAQQSQQIRAVRDAEALRKKQEKDAMLYDEKLPANIIKAQDRINNAKLKAATQDDKINDKIIIAAQKRREKEAVETRKLAAMQTAAYKEDAIRFPKQTMFGGIQEWFSKGAGKIATTIASFYSLYQVWRLCAQAAKFLFNESIQLQTSFARINAMALVSGKNYTGLRKAIFDLGNAHGFLATEVTTAIQPLVQMGLTTEEISVITNRAMQVSNITGTALGESINTVISAMASYNLTAQESADLMVYWGSLASTHAVSIHSIAKGFEQAGETFHEFGFNVKEVSSIMAVLMEQERGSLAGITRFLRLVLENLGKTKEASDIYKYMGVTVLDPTGGLRKDSFQVLKEMSVAWESMTGAQKNNLKQGMTNKSMMEGLYAVMAKFPEIEEAIHIGLEKGRKSLDAQSKLIENTVQNRWVALKNVWVDISSGKAEGAITYITRTTDALIEMSKALARPEMGFWKTFFTGNAWALEEAINKRSKPGELSGSNTTLTPEQQEVYIKSNVEEGSVAWQEEQKRLNQLGRSRNIAKKTKGLSEAFVTAQGKKPIVYTKEERIAMDAAQKARDFANTDYAEWKKHQDKIQATNENNLKLYTEQYKLSQGYQVGINKELQDELTTRRELQDTLSFTSASLDEQLAKQKLLKEQISLGDIGSEADILKTQLEEVEKNISAGNLKLAETKTALELQETVVRKIGETYRNMILDTMVEIIEKTQNWLDLNYKLRDLLSNIGNDVLRKVLDRITGGFVDKLGSLGSLATNQKGSSTANIAGLGAVGVASAAGGYAYVKGKGWVPAKGTGVPGGLGFSDYAGAGMMGAAIGSNRGTKGMVGGSIGSMVGMGAGFAIGGPIGAQIGAMAGGWLGSLFGKPKKDENKAEETAKTWTSIPSKIDVTNSELQVVNRNLIALKEKLEPFPLPSSYYFSARGNNAVGSGQWGNVTIKIDGSGDPQATANAVASIFSMNSLQGAQ